jgi:ABC-type glycerol-3-phosphate transport system substrate-binding protein
MNKRKICVPIILLMASLLVWTGCEKEPQERKTEALTSGKTAAQQRIIFEYYFHEFMWNAIDTSVRAFNQRHPDLRLDNVALDHESFKPAITKMLLKQHPPDLFSYWAGARTQAVVERALVAPIDDVWTRENFDQRFPAALVASACTYQGRKYLVPVMQHYVAFFYNKKLFEQHHISIPVNWTELINVCASLRRIGVIPLALGSKDGWPAQFWFDYLLLRTAGPEYRAKLMQGEAGYDDPEVLAVFEIWRSLIRQGYFVDTPNHYTEPEAVDLVQQGKAAMVLDGTWITGYFQQNFGWKSGEDFDFFSFPVIDPRAPLVALGPVDGVILARDAPNPSGAEVVLEFLADVDFQQVLSRDSGALAPNVNVSGSQYTELQRRIMTEIRKAPYWAFNYDLATPPAVAEVGLDSFRDFIDFPDNYAIILQKAAEEVKDVFKR